MPSRGEALGLNNAGRQKILEFQELNKEVVQLPWSGQKENPVLKQKNPHGRPAGEVHTTGLPSPPAPEGATVLAAADSPGQFSSGWGREEARL